MLHLRFVDLAARPSSDISMREKNAPGNTGSVYMRTSSVALLNLQLRETENDSYYANSLRA
eukprot:4466035-Pyramimonas_sp.AAC.1